MRTPIAISCLAVLVGTAGAQTRPAVPTTAPSLEGSWRSEDVGLDYPMFLVETFAADGSVRTDLFSKRPGQPVKHSDKVLHARWRIENGALEMGRVDGSGAFMREGQAWPVHTDASGKVASIDGWTRLKASATQPTSQPTGGR